MRQILFFAALLATTGCTEAQYGVYPTPPPAPLVQIRSPAELDQLLGPIALYPDPLIAQILPASTLPSEIVMADRFMSSGFDPNVIDQQPWDPSVKALARYPTVLKWMDDNLPWTTALGQAFQYQQPDVMNSIQRLRAQAMAWGNLETTPQETVFVQNGIIQILPPNPEVIYVPSYQPNVVYYQRSYGPPLITFGTGLPIGVWLNHDFDWRNHDIVVWRHDEPRPPGWWSRPPAERPHPETVWRPQPRPDFDRHDLDRGWGSPPHARTFTWRGGKERGSRRNRHPP